jgi:hypothetical protein
MRKLIYVTLIILILASCSSTDDERCDDFSDVARYQSNTLNGIPYGAMSLNVQGTMTGNYSPELVLVLSRYHLWKSMYIEACGNDLNSDDEVKYYHGNARYYANQLIAIYRTARNVILEFDGVSSFAVTLRPVDPDSVQPDTVLISITDLLPGDIGVEITLDSAAVNRLFIAEHQGALYSSLEAGSALKMKILNIRPVNEITAVEVNASSILFDDTGNMESVSIGGSINAWRE